MGVARGQIPVKEKDLVRGTPLNSRAPTRSLGSWCVPAWRSPTNHVRRILFPSLLNTI
jgi:hypothetical protein